MYSTKNLFIVLACLLFSLYSCKKKEIASLQTNLSVPQNLNLIEPTPEALAGIKGEIDEIIKIARVNNDGLIFLARKGTNYICGKLNKQGYSLEFVNHLNYTATDLNVDSSNSGESWRYYVSGDHPTRQCGAVYEYLSFTGQPADIGYFPSLASVDAMQYDYDKYAMTCVGRAKGNITKVYQFNEHKDYIVVSDSLTLFSNIGYNISQLAKEESAPRYLVTFDSSQSPKLMSFDLGIKKIGIARKPNLDQLNSYNPQVRCILRPAQYGDSTVFVSVSKKVPVSDPFPSVPTSSGLELYYLGNQTSYYPPHHFVINSMAINNCRINDIKSVGNTVYACGVVKYNEFVDYGNIVGNAVLLKFKDNQVTAYTFGDKRYLTEFNSMETLDGNLFLVGYTEKYFLGNNYSWFTDPTSSKPYFIKIPLNRLQ